MAGQGCIYIKADRELSICYTMAASGPLVIHEWSVLIVHESVARVGYSN